MKAKSKDNKNGCPAWTWLWLWRVNAELPTSRKEHKEIWYSPETQNDNMHYEDLSERDRARRVLPCMHVRKSGWIGLAVICCTWKLDIRHMSGWRSERTGNTIKWTHTHVTAVTTPTFTTGDGLLFWKVKLWFYINQYNNFSIESEQTLLTIIYCVFMYGVYNTYNFLVYCCVSTILLFIFQLILKANLRKSVTLTATGFVSLYHYYSA